MLAKDIKRGAIVDYNGAPCMIESITVQTPSARGAATLYKYRARNLLTKQKVDIVLKGTEGLDEADFERRAVTYMYADGTHVHFLDSQNYEQYSLAIDDVEEELKFLKEGLEGLFVLIYQEQAVGIQLPLVVELEVVECDPYVKGNSATSRTKPAKLETGAVIQVPEYLSQGEIVKVDTRTGEFISRA
ncbi:MAG: elongation factor P [Planctomycetota bacterium]|nr:MAG: elongation factor P [Planctomycetota bacterium]